MSARILTDGAHLSDGTHMSGDEVRDTVLASVGLHALIAHFSPCPVVAS